MNYQQKYRQKNKKEVPTKNQTVLEENKERLQKMACDDARYCLKKKNLKRELVEIDISKEKRQILWKNIQSMSEEEKKKRAKSWKALKMN